jgi:twitching motility protein PilU
LFELYNKGYVSYDEAIRNADSANGLRLQIKLSGERKAPDEGGAAARPAELSMLVDEPEEDAPGAAS